MGTTIRRQPVKFDIPKSPDYKFLNITNFRGLDISSNPFELATNTASDCLNVYVDETNTLTTRPRLDKKVLKDKEGENILPLKGGLKGVYPLHDGYIFHYSEQMKMLRGDNLIEISASNGIPQMQCTCFEHGDKVYLLGDGRYMEIDSYGILKDVEGEIPTTAVVNNKGERKEIAPINLLSRTFKETYYWDGRQPLEIDDPLAIRIEDNNYADRKNLWSGDTSPLGGVKLFRLYDDYSFIAKQPNAWLSGKIYYYTSPDKLATLNEPMATGADGYVATSATDAKNFWCINSNVLSYYYFDHVNNKWLKSTTTIDISSASSKYYQASPKGDYLYLMTKTDSTTSHFLYSRTSSNTFTKTTLDGSALESSLQYHDGYVRVLDTDPVKIVIGGGSKNWYVCDATNKKFTGIFDKEYADIPYYGFLEATKTGSLMWSYSSKFNRYLFVSELDGSSSTYVPASVSTYHVADDLSYGYYYKKSNDGKYDIWVTNDYTKIDDAVKMGLSLSDDVQMIYSSDRSGKYGKIDLKNAIFVQPHYGLGYYGDTYGDTLLVWNPEGEAHIDVYKELQQGTNDYIEWDDKRQRLLQSTLTTRFDNNYWFATQNRYYRSFNNNPTYFPITEYHDLGDSNEEITGFNLANDTTLIAYKRDKLYLIQPFTSSQDTTEYTITESKNTVGNTASGAPIVTTLTEIPLQINNDGIYGLSQMANVSSTERIADLMSESINEKWLDIPSQYIENIKTLNRLYWTYIVIPRPDKNNTWIYILDNRTNSWYYWELPIVTVNAFAKDNRAEFVDTNGNIYYLTTEDIINKAFEPLVTEYYDVGNKLIPWYWQSQILPLGTMNYSKRLVNTTFVLTDTDNIDGYGLNYSFKVFRKLASSVADTEMSGDLNLVRSTTKKTNISRFGFIQLKLSNINRDSEDNTDQTIKAYRNNKLRLVGLGLKYVLLEGLIK